MKELKRKRILVINSNAMFKEGDGLYIYKETGILLNELSKDYEVDNFHFQLPFNGNDAMANYNLNETAILTTTVNRRKSKIASYIAAFSKGTKALIKSDILYLFYPNSFSLLAIIARLLNKPYGLYIRGEKGITSKRSIQLYKKAAFILTVSPKFTSIAAAYNKNSATISPMIAYSKQDLVLNRTYIKKDDFVVLFVGRIEYAKGVFELIDAISNLKAKHAPRIKLVLIGDGDDTENIKTKVNDLDLEDNVEFTGSVYDKNVLADYYRRADIFILPTHHEGFPRVLYEAMIFGVPIITTFVGSISYIMKDHQNCYEIKPKDARDIEAKLMNLITNYREASFVAENGTRTILEYLEENSETHLQKINNQLESIWPSLKYGMES